jgi:nucleotide-binding universal stress UspA family protein
MAATLKTDAIVMGTHGRRGLSHLMSGSVAEAVLRKADCPVITVKHPRGAVAPRESAAVGTARQER